MRSSPISVLPVKKSELIPDAGWADPDSDSVDPCGIEVIWSIHPALAEAELPCRAYKSKRITPHRGTASDKP